jgi:hypothetical protein
MDERRRRVRTGCAAFLIWLAAAGAALADPPSKELWPEIDTWLRLSPAWRLSVFVPHLSVEPYFDSRYQTVNRLRLAAGASAGWSPRAAIETNVTYQYDSHASTKELFALNVILHVFFDRSRRP